MAQYTRLSAQDAAFLASDCEQTPMIIGALGIYDGKPLTLGDGSLDFDRIVTHIAGALHRSPTLTRQLSHVPLFGNPIWIDAPKVDLEHHLNRAAIPAPGHVRSLMDFVGRIYNYPLPRDRPLWDMWIIEGLSDQRFALLVRIHHALMDGGAGLEVLGSFHSLTPEPTVDAKDAEDEDDAGEVKPWRGTLGPRPEQLISDEIAHRMRGFGTVIGDLIQNIAAPRRAFNQGLQLVEGVFSLVERIARPSPLNGPIRAARRVSWLSTPLDELRTIKRRLGGTLNDAVLAVTAGALRKALSEHGRAVDELRLRVACPSNSRPPDEAGASGNHTASFIIDLPVNLSDPLDRYDAVLEATRHAKVARQADAVQFVFDLADRAAPDLVGTVMSMAGNFQNLVVSNIAGPPVPIYMTGCRVEELYILTILMPNTALAITLFSYDGRMSWSLCADWELIPNLVPLERAIREEIALLSGLEMRE